MTPDTHDLFYHHLAENSLIGQDIPDAMAMRLLTDPQVALLPLLHAAFRVRERHFGRLVRLHILNNAQNGLCPEDCHYCAQSTSSQAAIPQYRLKSDEEILAGAGEAVQAGAYRYCVVLSGRGPASERIRHLAALVRRIKSTFSIQVCLSAGMIDPAMAATLKEAGLDRYNHNLNTADGYYGRICTTHSYAQRLATLAAARSVGLEVCSGMIVGMGESPEDILEVARTLRRLSTRSIPVNFYVPIPGTALGTVHQLTPEYCLRILALFRLLNPDAEIRAAGGREYHLRSLEALALYPANGIFSQGYLNAPGHGLQQTLDLIQDAGFQVERIEE